MSDAISVEFSSKEMAKRLWEDARAKNHGGYFKLWSMKLTEGRNSSWGELPWIKDEMIGIFSTRESCEAFLALIEHGPEATYEFCEFNHGIDHIHGHWAVSLDRNGELRDSRMGSYHGRAAKWNYDWKARDGYSDSFSHDEDRNTGYARTKEEAVVKARAYMAELAEFIRVERPKRAEGCWCQPGQERLCGKCEDAAKKQRKKDCGCPHCAGDH